MIFINSTIMYAKQVYIIVTIIPILKSKIVVNIAINEKIMVFVIYILFILFVITSGFFSFCFGKIIYKIIINNIPNAVATFRLIKLIDIIIVNNNISFIENTILM